MGRGRAAGRSSPGRRSPAARRDRRRAATSPSAARAAGPGGAAVGGGAGHLGGPELRRAVGAEHAREQRHVAGSVEASGGLGPGALAGTGPADQRVGGAAAGGRAGLARGAVERVPSTAGVTDRRRQLRHRVLVDHSDRRRIPILARPSVADHLDRHHVSDRRNRLQRGGHPVRLGALLGVGQAPSVRIEDLAVAGLWRERASVPDAEPVADVRVAALGAALASRRARRNLLAAVRERFPLGGDEAVIEVLVGVRYPIIPPFASAVGSASR